MIWFIVYLAVIAGLAWVMRLVGQKVTNNAPKFRDMPYGVAFGYVLGAALLLWLGWAYLQSRSSDPLVANKFFFLKAAVEGFVIFAVAAYLFKMLGKAVGTDTTKKMFRTMPLTAAFGVLIIIIYVIVAIFAPFIAPYGQDEILQGVAANIVAGGDPALGGNPDFPLGTDQIGRDILSRLIYGAQNTVGIAFITTVLAHR